MKYLLLAALLFACDGFAQEDKLIAVLKSDASLKEKTDACRELRSVGTAQAVPVLAPLLTDEKLPTMAHYTLEPIPDPSVDIALRSALGMTKGQTLAGVIFSLGVRHDAQAIDPIARFLHDADPVVAQTAARAMGRLGTAAADPLLRAFTSADSANRMAVCDGLFYCAETAPAAEAVTIYDMVRARGDVPLQARIAAWTGAIRSRGAEGLQLLAEAVRGQGSLPAPHGIRIAMDLPGPDVTKVLVRAIGQSTEDNQTLLIQALGYRGDPIATRALLPLAQTGPTRTRTAALRALVQLGDVSALPVLVAAIKDPDSTVSSAAQAGLFGFAGKGADAAVLGLLKQTDPKLRVAAIGAVSQRRIDAAIPLLLKSATDGDVSVASASYQALGELAEVSDVAALATTLEATKSVAAAEAALASICSRQSNLTACVEQLVSALAAARGEPKLALLRVLGAVGGATALAAVRTALTEANDAVKETALRTLCDWPTAEALPDLATISRTTTDPKAKLLSLRGQLRLIPTGSVPDAQKLTQLKEVLPLLEHAEEQRIALAILGDIHCPESLALVVPFLSNAELKEEAAMAAVSIGEKIVSTNPEAVARAMKRLQSGNQQIAGRARKLLERAER